uniref:S8 family serine peptidase n=1 Tax=Micromonospora sp. (strain ATCC 39149 / NRRL 15099 / SCC 1413) TaxID=219305 RepID=UPI000682509D|nr:S8 family serine peptidase [Micromonospora sp. ATCC 39149]
MASAGRADAGADVINLSIGAPGSDPQITEAVQYALGKGAVLVAAAATAVPPRPCRRRPTFPRRPHGRGNRARADPGGAGRSPGPELGARRARERIISPAPPPVSPNGYGVGDGTSDAAAIVSGVAALVRSRYPKLDAANVVNRLIRTARDRGAPGRDPEYGFGGVDVLAALTATVSEVDGNPLLAGGSAKPTGSGADAAADDSGDDRPAVSFGLADNAPIQLALCLLVVLLAGAVIVALIVVNRRAARRRVPPGPPTRPHQPDPYPSGPRQPGPVAGAAPPGPYPPYPPGPGPHAPPGPPGR